MASSCNRFINRSSLSSIRSVIRSNVSKSPTTRSATTAPFPLHTSSTPSPLRRFSLSRIGMRAVAIATAQRRGVSKDDLVPQHKIEELPSTFTGHIRNRLGFAGPVNYAHCIIIKVWSVSSKVTQ